MRRLHSIVLLLALLFAVFLLNDGKPFNLEEVKSEDVETEPSDNESADKKDEVSESTDDDENGEKRDAVDDATDPDTPAEDGKAGKKEMVEEADEDDDDDDNNDAVAKKEEVADTKNKVIGEHKKNGILQTKKLSSPLKKRDGGGGGGGDGDEHCCHNHEHEDEHCCHQGEECCHEHEHGHHDHDQHEHEQHHHDHGYEFYEEWGEHGAHEGGEHGHHACCHEGEHQHEHEHEHECCHGHHEHEHEHEQEHGDSDGKSKVPKKRKEVIHNADTLPKARLAIPNAKKWWMVGEKFGGRGHEHWGPPHTDHEHDHGGGGWQYEEHGYKGKGGEHDGDEEHHKSKIPCCRSTDINVRQQCHCEDHGHHDEGLHGVAIHVMDHGGHGGDGGGHGGDGGGHGGDGGGHGVEGGGHGGESYGYGGGHGGDGGGHGSECGGHGSDGGGHGGDDGHGVHGCEPGGNGGEHGEEHGGYHFHDPDLKGGHDNEDHDLKGKWEFGYDGFGDDWGDWDHNHGNFKHLQHLDNESHGGGDCTSRRGCLPASPPEEGMEDMHAMLPVPGMAPVPAMGPVPVMGPSPYALPPLMPPVPYGLSAPFGPAPAPVDSSHTLPYRVCHDCHTLEDGGSRCICKAVRPMEEQSTNFNHHVYVDCDAVRHHPHVHDRHHICYPRADILTPEKHTESEAKAKQGVVYPYVGYGPWSAYPWWGDWWGGHGHHGWGNQNQGGIGHEGCEHGCEHSDHHAPHHGGGHHTQGPAVGYSFNGGHLNSYRCHDIVESESNDPATRSKRFCVPIGYHGGYDWPYWHGYPGVGTGLWGWGWPWIKNKVPGSKGTSKVVQEGSDKTKAVQEENTPNITRKSIIPEIPATEKKGNITKKQTIHVGYGYASGDNYRLGYGFGGMGGVSNFLPGSPSSGSATEESVSRSRIENGDLPISFRKTNIPKPEIEKTVTGSKRDIDINSSVFRRQDTQSRKFPQK